MSAKMRVLALRQAMFDTALYVRVNLKQMFVHGNELSFSSVEGKPLRMLTPLQRRPALEARHPEWRENNPSPARRPAPLAFPARRLLLTQSPNYSDRALQNCTRTQ